MKTILVPTDFSAYSDSAIHAAAKLAEETGAKIILAHTVFTDENWKTLSPSSQLKFPETLKKIQDAQTKIQTILTSQLLNKIHAEDCISYGIPHEEILAKSKIEKADLIVMGSHGNERSERFYIGSTVQKVLREATCPVFLIKNISPHIKFKTVALAVDLSFDVHKSFEKINNIIKALNATVYLIFVNRPSDFMDTRSINKMMDDFISRYPDINFHKVPYNHIDVAEGILQYTEDRPTDMIALITHYRKGKPGYLIGNTETIAFRSSIPVLSINLAPEPLSMDSTEKAKNHLTKGIPV